MKDQMKRICTGLLAFLTVSSVLASCGDAASPAPKETEKVQNADTTAVTDTAETEEYQPMPDLPVKDYGGHNFLILTSSDKDDNGVDWVTKDVYAAEATGDVVTDAVYNRNLWLEDTYNIHISEYQCATMSETKKAVQAGVTDYDAVMTGICNGCSMGADGFIYNLYDIPYIDLTQKWWDQGVTAGTSIDGKVYIATGDITIVDNDATWTLMFNKKLANDMDYDFYQMVRDNKWDMETFYNCAKTAVKDLNGDGNIKGQDDQFGFATTGDSCGGLMYASGIRLSKKDEDDLPILEADIGTLTEVVTKTGAIMSDKKTTVLAGQNGVPGTDDLRLVFEDGRSLFYGEVMQCVTRMRESKTDFGLIPFPKYDLAQESYYHYVHRSAGKGVCIPVTEPDPEMTGIILEAMAAKSVYTLTEAYYDKALTYKYMRDEESAEMLGLILSTRVYDLMYIYDWGSLYTNIVNLIKSGKTDVASAWEKRESKAKEKLQATIDAYLENE